jgi:hypothetical protein
MFVGLIRKATTSTVWWVNSSSGCCSKYLRYVWKTNIGILYHLIYNEWHYARNILHINWIICSCWEILGMNLLIILFASEAFSFLQSQNWRKNDVVITNLHKFGIQSLIVMKASQNIRNNWLLCPAFLQLINYEYPISINQAMFTGNQ